MATTTNPVYRSGTIHKAKNLDLFDMSSTLGPVADGTHRFSLTIGDTRRSHLDAVYAEVVEQAAGNGEFLVGYERYAAGLFAIAQRSVHYLNMSICHKPILFT